MNILVVMQIEEYQKEVLKKAAPEADILYIPANQVTREQAQEADVIVGNIAPDLIKECKNLKLLQLNSAGTDGYTVPGVLPENAMLTNATGAYGLAIAEHMLGTLLCMMKKLDLYQKDQQNHTWGDHGRVASIYGSKTLVVGLGDIGGEFALRMKAMGSSVTGIKRRVADKPDYLDGLHQMDDLYTCLENVDIVAACLPGTEATYKIFDAQAFSHMKDGAYFLNVGRGNAVDADALYDALKTGKLAGAALDVTDPEPLPANHKLWDAPGVLITPHISGGYHLKQTHDRIIEIAARNIGHLLKNEPYENEVDFTTGYKK